MSLKTLSFRLCKVLLERLEDIGGQLTTFWPDVTAHAQKLLLASFRSKKYDITIRFSDPDFVRERQRIIVWRSDNVFKCFNAQIENLPYFYFRFI